MRAVTNFWAYLSGDQNTGYRTDFSAMPKERIEKLSKRGEHLTRALIAEYSPKLA
jgi:NTE family protein